MKVGFVIVAHQSEMRKDGFRFIDEYIQSLIDYAKFPYEIYLIDNQSSDKYDYMKWSSKVNIKYTYISNQFEKGLTGAWNEGIHQAYMNKCDLIMGMADDMFVNSTINNFVTEIQNHPLRDISVFCPVSTGIWSNTVQYQKKPVNNIFELDGTGNNIPNGFFFGFTRKFYEKFRHSPTELFALKHKHDGGDGKWGGQEGEFWRMQEQGARFFVIGQCWLYHYKLQGYRYARKLDNQLKG